MNFQQLSDPELESLIDRQQRDEAVRAWQDAQREEESGNGFLFAQLVEQLGIIFEFLAASTTPSGMAARAWVMLYAVRPDLIRHETAREAAERMGVSEQRLFQQLEIFRRRTGYVHRSRVGACDATTRRKIVEAMSRARSEKAVRFRDRNSA
jgi:hypothetical protein